MANDKTRSPRGYFVHGYAEAFEKFKTENPGTKNNILHKIGILLQTHNNLMEWKRVDYNTTVLKLKEAKFDITLSS